MAQPVSVVCEVVCGGDLEAESVVAGDELAQELVQAGLEDGVHVALRQQSPRLVREALAPVAVAVEAAKLVEGRHQLLVAGPERARHLAVEDQVVRDLPGLETVLVDPAVAAVCRHGAQDRRPLHAVDLAADDLAVGQKDVILDVEDAHRVVRALQERAELVEVEGIVAQDGVEERAAEQRRAFLDPVEQRRQLVGGERLGIDGREFDPGGVEALPHLPRQRRALCARVAPRRGEAREDA